MLAEAFGGTDKWSYTARKRKRKENIDVEEKNLRKKDFWKDTKNSKSDKILKLILPKSLD